MFIIIGSVLGLLLVMPLISARGETARDLFWIPYGLEGVLVEFVFTNLAALCKLVPLCQDITMEGSILI